MKKLVMIAAVAAVLAGCSESELVQTVDWYKEHKAERLAMLEKCRDNPGEKQLAPNCVNAKHADKEVSNARRGYVLPPPAVKKEG